MTLQCKQWQRKTWEKWEVSINKRFCQCCLSIKQTCVLRATYPQQRKKTVYHKDKDLCLSLMWHISNTQQEKGAQLLLICLTIYPSSSFYPVQACKGQEPISAVRGPSQRDTQSLIYQANLEPVNRYSGFLPKTQTWRTCRHHTAVPDLSYPSEMLLCTPFFFIFHKAYFSQLLIILQFAGESLSKYGFNKSSLLQANLITNSKGWPGTWLRGHFHRREKTEQWVVHSASCTQNCTNTAAVDFYVNWQQGQHCHF